MCRMKPFGQLPGFGSDVGLGDAALKAATMLLLDKIHATRPPRRTRPVILRFAERPTACHVRPEDLQAPPSRAMPVFQAIIVTAPPMFLVKVGTRNEAKFIAKNSPV